MAPTVPIDYIGRGDFITCSQNSSVVMMGKAKKFSKGGFVSDSRHAVETMAELNGFAERNASEDSYGPKRKSFNPNLDSNDRFAVPFQVFSLSKLSPLEKLSLEKRFKSELERVQLLQKKITSMQVNVLTCSPSSGIHSLSEGKRRPPLEYFHKAAEVSTSQSKKRGFPGKNGFNTKQPSNSSSTMLKNLKKQCENLLKNLMTHKHGWVFNKPVDVVELNIPDYFNVIKHPMDLGTVKRKLLSGAYTSPSGFAADVRLTFSNAKTYNPVGNDVHIMADLLSKIFEAKWRPIERKVPIVIEERRPATSSVYVEPNTYNHQPPNTYNHQPPTKKKKTIPTESKDKHEPVKLSMPVVDKQQLSQELEDLIAELPDNIIEFLKKQSCNGTQIDEDEIEIDIDTLSYDTLLTLRTLLDAYLLDKQKQQGSAEPCEMELHNESGVSNSSMPPPQGNEQVDEDVDIGGNDPPVSRYPPVRIEKEENATRPDKHSSSSSSSGSSSSDSDSGSSSGSESDGEKPPSSAIRTQDIVSSEADIEQKTKDTRNIDVLSGSDQAELNTKSKEDNSFVAEGHQEGESAPLERQVSPDKLYRAAILRNRFADTILKAQEKTFDKGEKQNPEKLRLEKEELERRKIEEKARLLAEAKAAEEACRKADADAAAEAKRKRDLDREAARLALQKLEKTVDIQGTCQFLEDLEMLRGDVSKHVESLKDEASPDVSQDNLGSFKFPGNSNPLEQLGLYMKMDEEDDEEAEPQGARTPDDADNENNAEQENDVGKEETAEEGKFAEKENDDEEKSRLIAEKENDDEEVEVD